MALALGLECSSCVTPPGIAACVRSVKQLQEIAFILCFLLILFLLRYPEWNPDSDSGHGM